jgi:hypothetical protein
MDKKDEPTVGLDRLGEPIVDPAPDRKEQDDWPVEIWTGTKWGMVAGVAADFAYMHTDAPSLVGLFPGDAGLVLVPVGCAAVGAAIGWLWVHVPGR